MALHLTSFVQLFLLASILPFVVAITNWRMRQRPGIRSLALALFFIGIAMLINGLESAIEGLEIKIPLFVLQDAASGIFLNYLLFYVIQSRRLDRFLGRYQKGLIWGISAFFLLVEITNPLHRLHWTSFEAGPPGSNQFFPQHGPSYFVMAAYISLQAGVMLFIIAREAIQEKGWRRQRAIGTIISIAFPLTAYNVYAYGSAEMIGMVLLPLMYALSGMLLTTITFEDLRVAVEERSALLEQAVWSLEAEVLSRKTLEGELRQSQETLAARLADQSRNFLGLYNLILVGNKPQTPEELLRNALDEIQHGLNSEAVCFYRVDSEMLRLQGQKGVPADHLARLQLLHADWMNQREDARADMDTANSPDLPPALAAAGYGACLWKWVELANTAPGLLGILWHTPRTFAVEEIVLFSGTADILAVILENARLRQTTADTAILQERRRLARDLHDSVTQSIHSLVYSAETARQLAVTHPERMEKSLKHLILSARQALKEMRLLLYELRLASPFESGIADALKNRLEAVEQRAEIAAALVVEPGANWPLTWEKELYPLAMEALNNALKHAHATQVDVCLRGSPAQFELSIHDNGCGFDPRENLRGGMGLSSMQERAERLSGRLMIETQPGAGTTIRILIGEP